MWSFLIVQLMCYADLDAQFGAQLETVFSSKDALDKHVLSADLVIGGVLIPGAAAPKASDRRHDKTHEARRRSS
ncbi:MAG: hypothetical protein Q9M92_12240 [Enterobacterales bacterium]|nr:hypothetical protein [Enterobacterales bacterium]